LIKKLQRKGGEKVKKVRLVLVAILILLSGTMVGCGGEQPPDKMDMVRYVQHNWHIDASSDDILQVLALEDSTTGDDFSSEVGAILTIISMKEDIDRGDYNEAAKKATEWLYKNFFLKESDFSWLSGYVNLGVILYDYYLWLIKKSNEEAFNAQVQYYLWYREDGYSEEEMKNYFAVRPGGYLQNPRRLGTIQPMLTSEFTPEDVFRVGRAFWEAEQGEKYRAGDEGAIKQSFINALEQLREGKAAPTPTPTPTPQPEVIKWVYETNSSPTCVAVSADGNYVAIGTSDTIYFLDSNKNLLWTYKTSYPITDVSLRANGSRVIASGLEEDIISDGVMYYLNNQGKLVSSIEPNGISSISLSPEGKYFAMTTVSGLGWNDEVALCGFNEGKWLWRRGFAMEETTSVSISTNGDYIAAGGSPGPTDNGGVRLYNKNGTLLWDYDEINKKELGYDKYSVSISSDGNYIAVGHEGEDNLYFFNKKGEVLWKYNTEKIKGVSISDNGDFIAAASSKKIYLLKRDGLNEPTLQWSFGLANIEDVSISGNAKLLAAATQDNKVYAFDLGGLLH